MLPGELHKRQDVVLVDAPFDDRVELDRRKAGFLCRKNAFENFIQIAALGHALELVRVQSVDTDVDATQACL